LTNNSLHFTVQYTIGDAPMSYIHTKLPCYTAYK